METGYANGIATLVSLADGSTNLYLSAAVAASGPGVNRPWPPPRTRC